MAKEQIVQIDDTGSTLTYKEEVVRCRNCRWREDDQCGYFEFELKHFNNYCSWAKPREEK